MKENSYIHAMGVRQQELNNRYNIHVPQCDFSEGAEERELEEAELLSLIKIK